jgi:transcriptional regulator with XRE-family HTH domain
MFNRMALKVREKAEQKGYSIRRLSHESGVPYQTVFRYWHNYIRSPHPDILKKLAQVLQVNDWRELLSED